MLVWGDFVFIPFVFSVQGWFLLHNTTVRRSARVVPRCCLVLIGCFRRCHPR
jgi:delta14-sterol reductase